MEVSEEEQIIQKFYKASGTLELRSIPRPAVAGARSAHARYISVEKLRSPSHFGIKEKAHRWQSR